MLRQFHFIDQNGKDQGVNVRNRAKELAELLSDVDRIRAERKKARATRNKYTGVEGGAGLGAGMSSSSRYGGFGSEEQVAESSSASSNRKRAGTERSTKKVEPPKKKEPEVDLFSFDDPIPVSTPAVAPAASSALADDDDFDDFQSATPAQPAAPAAFSPISPPTSTTTFNTQYAAPTACLGTKSSKFDNILPSHLQLLSHREETLSDLYGSTASAGIKKTSTPTTSGPALGQLAKEKASAGIWGASSTGSAPPQNSQQKLGNGLDDLLG
ncbi:hypothetical protein DID88_000512 [Monilinia fructigena]|uniref:ENTH domain-containing protein n=1 Tax=Monilinia fructigena TaxID=38457 RepID=A0A395IHT7_9HELO|nr:hypothetical protein DID88_000512 [Monilinia fructigena]